CVAELELALRAYEALADVPRIALLHHDLGVAYQTLGKPEAQAHFERALEHWRSANNAAGLANTLNSIGVSHHRQGNYAAAVETLEQALIQARRAGQLRVEALALASLGDVQRDLADYASAQRSYQTAYDIGVQIRSGFVITYALNALGETYRLLGDTHTASRLIRQALEQAESHASNYEVGLTKVSQGILGGALGETRESVLNLVQATALLDHGGAQRENARAHLHLALVHFGQRKYRLVAEQLKATAEIGRQIGEDQFAIADGKALLPLIRYAVSKGIGTGYFSRLLARIESGPPRGGERIVEPTAVTLPTVRAHAFGKATLSVDRKLLTAKDWDSAAAKELFFFMLANPKGLAKEQILGALWSGVRPARASSIFHSTVYRMRRALWSDCLSFENSIYRLTSEMTLTYDVAEFEELLRRAQLAPGREDKAKLWGNAVALYRGDYMEDSYDDWCTPIRAGLLEKYLATLESLAKLTSREGRNEQAISYYQHILAKDSLREAAYAAIMQLQIRSGDRPGALRTYRQCADVLREEMGLEPSPQTRLIYKQIARDDDDLT
ncbi:MAG: tetratricopeptide repeat protein, partial [Chloroflexi bacterium]|nr:tetratricopeptide repeat protein [Chloroflexota bacterium]